VLLCFRQTQPTSDTSTYTSVPVSAQNAFVRR